MWRLDCGRRLVIYFLLVPIRSFDGIVGDVHWEDINLFMYVLLLQVWLANEGKIYSFYFARSVVGLKVSQGQSGIETFNPFLV